jgi:hypothetical protein
VFAPSDSLDDGLDRLFLDDLHDFRDVTMVISNIDLHVVLTNDAGASLGNSQHLVKQL